MEGKKGEKIATWGEWKKGNKKSRKFLAKGGFPI